MKTGCAIFFVCALIILLPVCTDTIQLAGPSTEQGNPTVAGLIQDSSRSPAPDARVRIYRIPTTQSPDSINQPLAAIPVALTVSDKNGAFDFIELAPGRYSLEAQSRDSVFFAIKTPVIVDSIGQSRRPDTLILQSPGGISGVVTRGGFPGQGSNVMLKDAFIQVRLKEIDRSFTTGPDGAYRLNDIPPGAYTILFYAADGFFTAWRDSIVATPGTTALLDTVVLERIPWDAPSKPRALTADYDTVAATITLRWRPAKPANLRGYEIERIDSTWRTDTTFTTLDTTYSDTVTAKPDGMLVYYVVRSVSNSFMRSANEGPVAIRISHRSQKKRKWSNQ